MWWRALCGFLLGGLVGALGFDCFVRWELARPWPPLPPPASQPQVTYQRSLLGWKVAPASAPLEAPLHLDRVRADVERARENIRKLQQCCAGNKAQLLRECQRQLQSREEDLRCALKQVPEPGFRDCPPAAEE